MADNNLQAAIDWLKSPQRTQQVQGIGNTLEEAINNLHASRVKDEQLWNQAFQDPSQPLKVTNQEAFKEMTQRTMGGPMGFAPVGMVVGRGITQEAIARANQLLNINASPGTILQETGLVKVPTKDGFTWGRQISDAPISVDFEKVKNAPYDASFINRNPSSIEDVVSHPELFNLYPELKNIGVVKTSDGNAFYRSNSNEIGIPSLEFTSPQFLDKFKNDRTGMMVHELQHAVQTIENWPRGGNSAEFMGQAHKRVKEQADWAMKTLEDDLSSFLAKKELTPPKDFKSFAQSVAYIKTNGPKYLEDVGPESKKRIEAVLSSEQGQKFLDSYARIENAYKKIKDMNKSAGRKYTKLAGEGQARATEQQFLKNNYKAPVNSFYDVPVEDLIYKDPFGFTVK